MPEVTRTSLFQYYFCKKKVLTTNLIRCSVRLQKGCVHVKVRIRKFLGSHLCRIKSTNSELTKI